MMPGMTAQPATTVILEIGRKRAFACAAGWPARHAARRIGWHVLDHAGQIEGKSDA
jgi:hypothetical protein